MISTAHIFYIVVLILVGVFIGYYLGRYHQDLDAQEKQKRNDRKSRVSKS